MFDYKEFKNEMQAVLSSSQKVQTALLFGYVLPENTRADIEKMLKNIREKSPFEYDIALHMEVHEFCRMYLL